MLAEYGAPHDEQAASVHQFLRAARALGQTPEEMLARDHRWVMLQLESMNTDEKLSARDHKMRELLRAAK